MQDLSALILELHLLGSVVFIRWAADFGDQIVGDLIREYMGLYRLAFVQGIHLSFQLHRATGTGTGNRLICSSYHAGDWRKTAQCRNRYQSDDGGAVWIGNDAMMMQSIFRVDFRNN